MFRKLFRLLVVLLALAAAPTLHAQEGISKEKQEKIQAKKEKKDTKEVKKEEKRIAKKHLKNQKPEVRKRMKQHKKRVACAQKTHVIQKIRLLLWSRWVTSNSVKCQ